MDARSMGVDRRHARSSILPKPVQDSAPVETKRTPRKLQKRYRKGLSMSAITTKPSIQVDPPKAYELRTNEAGLKYYHLLVPDFEQVANIQKARKEILSDIESQMTLLLSPGAQPQRPASSVYSDQQAESRPRSQLVHFMERSETPDHFKGRQSGAGNALASNPPDLVTSRSLRNPPRSTRGPLLPTERPTPIRALTSPPPSSSVTAARNIRNSILMPAPTNPPSRPLPEPPATSPSAPTHLALQLEHQTETQPHTRQSSSALPEPPIAHPPTAKPATPNHTRLRSSFAAQREQRTREKKLRDKPSSLTSASTRKSSMASSHPNHHTSKPSVQSTQEQASFAEKSVPQGSEAVGFHARSLRTKRSLPQSTAGQMEARGEEAPRLRNQRSLAQSEGQSDSSGTRVGSETQEELLRGKKLDASLGEKKNDLDGKTSEQRWEAELVDSHLVQKKWEAERRHLQREMMAWRQRYINEWERHAETRRELATVTERLEAMHTWEQVG